MKKAILPANRPYDPRLFWVLMGLNVPATLAILPFAMNLRQAYGKPGTDITPGWASLAIDQIVTIVVIAILAGAGVALVSRIGLGLPYVESRLGGKPPPLRFRGMVAVSALAGIVAALLLVAADIVVFRSPMLRLTRELGIATPKVAIAPPFYGFLAAISAGITEETTFRLFGLSLLAWLGGFFIHDTEGRPRQSVLWMANILLGLAFGAAHLATARAVGLPLNALVLTRTFVLNGAAGLAYGWLFWSFGLESAMLGHFFADVVLYTLLPIILLQKGVTATILAVTGVAIVILMGSIWALRTIRRERSNRESRLMPA